MSTASPGSLLVGFLAGVLLAVPTGAMASFGDTATATSTFTAATVTPATDLQAVHSCGLLGIGSGIALTWQPATVGATGQTLQRRAGSDAWGDLVSLSPTAASYEDFAISAGTTYRYRVVTRAGSWTATSAEVSVTTPGLLGCAL